MSHLTEQQRTDLRKATRDFIRSYDGKKGHGATGMAPELGKSPKLLANETNPNYAGAKFSFEDAVDSELVAGIYPLLHLHARLTGHVCYRPMEPGQPVGDLELINVITQFQADNGHTCEQIREALDPNGPAGSGVTHAEVEDIAQAGYRQISCFLSLLERFQAIREPDHKH